MFHGRFWLVAFLLLLFIAFLIVNVFSAKDLTVIFLIFLWLLLAQFFLSYSFVLFVAAFAALVISITRFSEERFDSGLQKFVRLSLAVLCGATVLPLIAEALLSLI